LDENSVGGAAPNPPRRPSPRTAPAILRDRRPHRPRNYRRFHHLHLHADPRGVHLATHPRELPIGREPNHCRNSLVRVATGSRADLAVAIHFPASASASCPRRPDWNRPRYLDRPRTAHLRWRPRTAARPRLAVARPPRPPAHPKRFR